MNHFVYWIVLATAIGLGTYLEGGNLSNLVHVNTAIFVFVPTLCYLLFSNGINGIGSFVSRLLSGNPTGNDRNVYRNTCQLAMLLGWLGALNGFIHVVGNGSTNWQAGLAIALTAALYGALPQLFFFPFTTGQESGGSINRVPSGQYQTASNVTHLAASLLLGIITVFAVSRANLSASSAETGDIKAPTASAAKR